MKKAQAALEFLTTYGWAILVVLMMVGALSHFGVLNPDLQSNQKCISPQGFQCEEHKMQDTDQAFRFRNTLGETINLQKTEIKINEETQDCMTDKEEVQPGEIFTVKCTSSETQKEKKTNAQIQIQYYQDDPIYSKTATATVTSISSKNTITPKNSVTFGTPEWKNLGEIQYYAELNTFVWKDSYLPCQEEDCALTFTSTLIQYNSQHNITSNSYAGRLKLNPQNLANYPAQQYCRSIGGQLPTIDQARAILANYQLAIPTTPHGSNVLGLVTSEYDFSTNYASNSLVQSGYIYKYVMKYSGNQINACTQDCFYTGISRLDHLGTNSYVLCIK